MFPRSLEFHEYFILIFMFLSTVHCVDIRMSYPLDDDVISHHYYPMQQICRNIPPGKCCNNIFHYNAVSVNGLGPQDAVALFRRHRQGWDYINEVFHARPGDAAIKGYGCSGQLLQSGFASNPGFWFSSAWDDRGGHYQRTASGAMWLSCADNPVQQLHKAFKPAIYGQMRVNLRAALNMIAGTCGIHQRRAADPDDHDDTGQDEASTSTLDSSDIDPTSLDSIKGPSSNISDAGWMFPDLLTFDGTDYVQRNPSELKYYDFEGNMLNMTAFTAPGGGRPR